MSKVWVVTGGSGGLGACGLIFCGLAVLTIALKAATYGSHGSRLEAWRASGQDASNSSIAKEHS
jgi:hypothetical protein